MNFDDLKKAWDNEDNSDLDLTAINLSLNKANNAIDKVRKNMRMDFYCLLATTILSLAGLIYAHLNLDVKPIIFFTLDSFAFLIFVLILFFFIKFYKFYKRSYHLNYDSRDNLMWFYYELRSFIDFYHAFFFVFFIMGLACGLAIGLMTANIEMVSGKKDAIGRALSDNITNKFIYFGSQAILILGGTLLFRWMISRMYGRYLKQIKHTLDLLRSDE